MGTAERTVAVALLALAVALAPALAQDASHPAHPIELTRGCLNQQERRALVENGSVLRLAAACTQSGATFRERWCARGFVAAPRASSIC